MPLSRAVALSVTLDAICARNQFVDDPAPVIDELRRTAGGRTDILAEAVGTWAGYFDGPHTHTLCEALLEIPGADEWVVVGLARRLARPHGTADYQV